MQPERQPGDGFPAHRLRHDRLDESHGQLLGRRPDRELLQRLKNERVHCKTYTTGDEVLADRFDDVEVFHNRIRHHGMRGCRAPIRILANWVGQHAHQQSDAA